jgi:hypothetical protein
MATAPPTRKIRLRYPGVCAICGIALSRNTDAIWDGEARKVICMACVGGEAPQNGASAAGGSALRRAEELEDRVIAAARKEHGDYAAAVAGKLAGDDPSVSSWRKGGSGESRLAAFVEREVGDAVAALHDRLIPGTRAANIDHIFVAASGVWIVDAKAYTGRVEKRDVGPFWRQELELLINGRNRTKLVDGVAGIQLKAVRAALEDDPRCKGIELHPALCLIDSEWALLARPFTVRGVEVLYAKALVDRLKKNGPLARDLIEHVAARLALSLPPAR